MENSQQVLPQDDIGPPDYELLDWQIDETIECLLYQAVELGEAHSQSTFQRTGKYAPFAHQATTVYHAIQIIRVLQQQIAELKNSK